MGLDMLTFIIGFFVALIAEYLFYNYLIKPEEDDTDISALKTELELKNRQISSLQSQLASISVATEKQSSHQTKTNKKSSSKPNTEEALVKKPVTKKPITKKAVTKKATVKQTSKTENSKSKGDDLTKLIGIGPSMAASLKRVGITSFKNLADTDDKMLRVMLVSSGARVNNNIEEMNNCIKQATVAATGDFEALKDMQEKLKK